MDQLFAVQYSYLIPLLPLIGACISGFFGYRWLKGQSHWPIWLGVGASAVLSIMLLMGTLDAAFKGADEAAATTQPAATQPTTTAAMSPADVAPATATTQPAATQPALATTILSTRDQARDQVLRHAADASTTNIWFEWAAAGNPAYEGISAPKTPTFLKVNAGAFFDPLTAVMLCVVTCIGFLITVFSKGYMVGEVGYYRFFAFLGLFIFAMTILVMGENLIMLYLGWEGVGLCSYLLIGYYYEKPSAVAAAKKAFIVNRIGDFGFGIGIMLCFLVFGTLSFYGGDPTRNLGILTKAADPRFISNLTDFQKMCVQWIPFCLMLGAFGKSAQFPLYVWLPDAMEGPTPVSALIHAATMVTAGVYMIARCSTLFVSNQAALYTIAVVGAFTAILAATIALRQFDLKKVFAYSTISQLGYMFVAVGVLAPVAGIFHLVTHAFFKALLFLSSGVVMHAMSGELDMRKMSGLKRVLPITHWCILAGCAALAGFPFVSGFFSKDDIVGAAFSANWILGGVMLLTSFMTAYYTFRLYFRVFQGPLVMPETPAPAHAHGHEPHEHATASASAIATGTAPASGVDVGQAHGQPDHGHADHGHHNHEPLSMVIPLILLAIGAILAGYLNWPEREYSLSGFLAKSPSFVLGYQTAQANGMANLNPANYGMEGAEPAPLFSLTMIVGGLVSLAGIGLAYILHLRDRGLADTLAQMLGSLVDLVENKFFVDEIYNAIIVAPLRAGGQILFAIDRFLVDGIINMFGWIPQLFGWTLKLSVQRGYLQGYATAMLFGIVIILAFMFL
jgi:NADH-quinone oxidoreductase subunit L